MNVHVVRSQAPTGYPLPPPGNPAAAAAELGMKVTVGMEMMYCARARFGSSPEQETTYTVRHPLYPFSSRRL